MRKERFGNTTQSTVSSYGGKVGEVSRPKGGTVSCWIIIEEAQDTLESELAEQARSDVHRCDGSWMLNTQIVMHDNHSQSKAPKNDWLALSHQVSWSHGH